MAKANPELLCDYMDEAGFHPGDERALWDTGEPTDIAEAVARWCALDCVEQFVAAAKKRLRSSLLEAARVSGTPHKKGRVLQVGDGSVRVTARESTKVDAHAVQRICADRGMSERAVGEWVFRPDATAVARWFNEAELAECITVKRSEVLEVIPPTPGAGRD